MNVPRARKRFGQHFLIDDTVIAHIVDLINAKSGEHLVEIGPGRSALTVPLLAAASALTVIEIDRDLGRTLSLRFADNDKFRLVLGDALQIDFGKIAAGDPLRVVGNLPYNISTPLILSLLAQAPHICDMTFMLQKEVVDRLAGRPDTKDYGRLSVMVQSQCQVEAFFEVLPDAFDPPPKVMSKLVRITPHAEPLDPKVRDALEQCVRIAFNQRRKTLNNTLGKHYARVTIDDADIDLAQRPGEIPVDAYVRLATLIAAA